MTNGPPYGAVLVCGLGRAGFRIVELLLALGEGVTVVTLEARPEWLRAAEAAGASVLMGDARDVDRLVAAGLMSCRALIAATDHDVANLECAMDARARRPDLPVVVRLFDRALLREIPAALGLNAAHAISGLSAPAFAAAAMGKNVVGAFSAGGAGWIVGRIEGETAVPPSRVLARSDAGGLMILAPRAEWLRLNGWQPPPPKTRDRIPLATLPIRIFRSSPRPLRLLAGILAALMLVSVLVFYLGLRLSAVDAVYFLVTTVTTTGYGDISLKESPAALKLYGCLVMLLGSVSLAILVSMLTDFALKMRLRELTGTDDIPTGSHILVVGLGGVGTRVVEELLLSGLPVVGIERDAASPLLGAARDQAPVVVGDARFDETLRKAGVTGADAVVAVTSDDATNLAVALAARRLKPGIRTVVRLFDADFARKAKAGLKLDAALSASRLAAPAFVASALYPDARAAFVSEGTFYVLVERGTGIEVLTRVLERSGAF